MHKVASQRQRIGSRNTTGVRGNRIYNTSGFRVFNLKHRALQQTAFELICDRIILRGFLYHLNLSENRRVFHDQFGRFSTADTQRANRAVRHIALRRCDFLDFQFDFAFSVR